MAKESISCPMKFNSRTLTDDGFVRKGTCECDEARCAWWNAEQSTCNVVLLARSFDSVQKIDKVKLKLMLASGKERETIDTMRMSMPYLEAEQEIRKALE
jgi:hypothetical protein